MKAKLTEFGSVVFRIIMATGLVLFVTTFGHSQDEKLAGYGQWMKKPQSEWPQITMNNQIEYSDANHPIAGCGFGVNPKSWTVFRGALIHMLGIVYK